MNSNAYDFESTVFENSDKLHSLMRKRSAISRHDEGGGDKKVGRFQLMKREKRVALKSNPRSGSKNSAGNYNSKEDRERQVKIRSNSSGSQKEVTAGFPLSA